MTPSLESTFERLMARASETGNLPGFPQSTRSILNALTADSDNDAELVRTVLADAGLTQHVLRLANSAMYVTFGGEVGTISRAIQVLGVQTLAHLALGLKIIESFDRERTDSAATLDQMQKAVLAGYLGRQLAATGSSPKDVEAAAVCSILMGLGRMLVAFYLPDAGAAIQAKAADGLAEADAVRSVLGASYADIGQRMARHWGLPASLTATLQPRTPLPGETPDTYESWLAMLATAATEGARILHAGPADASEALAGLVGTFSPSLGLEPGAMLHGMRTAHAAASAHFAREPEPLVRPATASERKARLLRGFANLQQAAKTAPWSRLLLSALEYLHGGFGASRSFAFLHYSRERCYRARHGVGTDAATLMPRLQFDSVFQPDVFHAVLLRHTPLFIEDAHDGRLQGKLPEWWRASLGEARSFCVIPLHLGNSAVGFLYLDWVPPMPAPRMDAPHMKLLSECRQVLIDRVSTGRL